MDYKRMFMSTAAEKEMRRHIPANGVILRRSMMATPNEWVLECEPSRKAWADKFVELFSSDVD